MKQAAAAKTTYTVNGNHGFGSLNVAVTFLDTTWRIATPVILFTLIGIYADLHLGTKPWLTFLCVIIGFTGAVLLVKRQLAEVAKADKSEPKK